MSVNVCPFPPCRDFTVIPKEMFKGVWNWALRVEPDATYNMARPSDASVYAATGMIDNMSLIYYFDFDVSGRQPEPSLFMKPGEAYPPKMYVEVIKTVSIQERVDSLQGRLDARVDCSRMTRRIKAELDSLLRLIARGEEEYNVTHYEQRDYPLDQVYPDGFLLWRKQ